MLGVGQLIFMKKGSYFSHDSTAKDDPKCMMLIDQLGLEGYGIYWVLIETLRIQPNYKCPLKVVPSLAKRYSTSAEKMTTVIRSFGLFQIEGDSFFYSESLMNRMYMMESKSKKLSEAGQRGNELRWKNRQNLKELSPPDSQAIATQSQIKEKKRKETKINENKINEISNESLRAKFLEWIDFRFEKKKPISTKAQEQQINFLLSRPAAEAIEIINQSIMNDWQGLFELKVNNKYKNRTDATIAKDFSGQL